MEETLKQYLERIWRTYPCMVPLEPCRWRTIGIINEILVTQLSKSREDEEDSL